MNCLPNSYLNSQYKLGILIIITLYNYINVRVLIIIILDNNNYSDWINLYGKYEVIGSRKLIHLLKRKLHSRKKKSNIGWSMNILYYIYYILYSILYNISCLKRDCPVFQHHIPLFRKIFSRTLVGQLFLK